MNKQVKIVIETQNNEVYTSIRGNSVTAIALLVKALADVYQKVKKDSLTAESFADEVAMGLKWFISAAEEL